MKAKFLRLLVLSSFILVGCNNSAKEKESTEPEQQQPSGDQGGQTPGDSYVPLKKKVNVKMEALLKGSDTPYNVEFDYDDSLFLKDAEVYDKDLSLLSLGAAISATYENWAKDFLRDCEFSDSLSHEMNIEPTENTLGYTLGHKDLNGSELFAVMIRGHEYKKEWANNFIIGETGDHQGWLARASELYTSLASYVNQYKGQKNVKLWIVGYSRAGAISNMLSSLIFRGNGFTANAKDMFVYTFEGPAGLTQEHAIKYKNVHNIVNSADIVAYIPPTQYELYRAGEDFEIYDANVATYVSQFDSQVSVPAWTTCNPSDFDGQTINNDVELTQYLINNIFANKENDAVSAHTRALYVQNYQSGLSYSVGLLLALSGTTRSQILADLQSNPMFPWNVLSIIGDDTGAALASTLSTYLDQDNITYDNDELVAACAVMVKAIQNLFMKFLGYYMQDTYKGNLTRILDMHYPEVTYCLLKNAHSKLA
jgi:hypothetical protein